MSAKKHLPIFLKITLVGVLFAVIFYNITWIDSYSRLNQQGVVLERVEGGIVGAWDQDTLRFLPTASSELIDLRRGVQLDGTTIAVSPGLPSYIRNLDIALFSLGALLFFIFIVAINSRWWFLLRANGLGVRFIEAQKFGWIGLFFNNVMPGATGGDVVKAVYIVRRCSGAVSYTHLTLPTKRIV